MALHTLENGEVQTQPVFSQPNATRPLMQAAGAISGLLFVGLILATNYDVVARYFFKSPTVWASELSTIALIVGAYVGAGYTYYVGGHIRVSVLLDAKVFAGSTARTLLRGGELLGLLVCGLAVWQIMIQTMSDFRFGAQLFGLASIPAWVPKSCVAAGLSLLLLAIVEEIRALSDGRRPSFVYGLVSVVVLAVAILSRFDINIPYVRVDLEAAMIVVGVLAIGLFVFGARASLFAALILCIAVGAMLMAKSGGPGYAITAVVGLLAILLLIGMRIFLALLLIGMAGMFILPPIPYIANLSDRLWGGLNSFSLTAVPCYVLMGAILVRSGLSSSLFAIIAHLLRNVPGGLAHAGVAGSTIFSAISGSSVATAATMGKVAIPEMTSRGYSERMTFGSIAAGGTLGILIPPSVPLIIYAITVGASITKIFLAGIVPGLMLAGLFILLIAGWSMLSGMGGQKKPRLQETLTRAMFVDSLLVVTLLGAIIFALYGSVATPSEIGAIGALIAFVICVLRKRMTYSSLLDAVAETVIVTSFVMMLMVSASILSFSFDFLKVPSYVVSAVADAELGKWTTFLGVIVIYLFLGLFLDAISMLVLTLPVVHPLMSSLGFDPIWTGIVIVIAAEIGLLTPPVGMNLFVIKAIAPQSEMRTIAEGAIPFIAIMLLGIAILCLYPSIALWPT